MKPLAVGGEQPLKARTSCLLGSLNLYEFVENKFTSDAHFNFEEFAKAIKVASNALDNIIEENAPRLPKELEQYKQNAYDWRNMGLGVFNYAHMLMAMGLKYGSEEALKFTDKLFYTMMVEAIISNDERGKEKGNYPKFKGGLVQKSTIFINHAPEELLQIGALHARNCTLLSIAPTGSISTMVNGSGGVEPEFALSYTRRTDNLNESYKIESNIVKEYRKITGNTGELPDYFVSSADIHWRDRIKTQAVIQQHIDTAISSTVNLPKETTKEEIEELYLYAWSCGLKGITIFRDGCKRLGILTTQENKVEQGEKPKTELTRGTILSVSDDLIGAKRKLQTGCVDSETEFFNGKKWKKISEYKKGDKVLQYNTNGTATLVEPLEYIKRPSKGQYHIKTKYGLDMMTSPDHRNITFIKDGKPKVMTTKEIIVAQESSNTGFTRKFKVAFDYGGAGIDLSNDEIRLSVAIFADGCFYSDTSKKCLISIKKKRKRDRLIEILNRSNTEYSERIDSNGYYNIKFYPPLSGKVKLYPDDWYNCSKEQLKIIFDEVFHWDGCDKENNQYTTVYKTNADFIQFVCASLGLQGSIYQDKRNNNITYRVDWSSRILRSFASKPKKEIPFVMPKDGYDYCFSVPSTMLILRRNDKIFVTGNCGSVHFETYFDELTGEPMETFINVGSTGSCERNLQLISRLMSLALRAGVSVENIIDQCKSIKPCTAYVSRTNKKHDTSKGSSCPSAIGYALEDLYSKIKERCFADFDLENSYAEPLTVSSPAIKEEDKIVKNSADSQMISENSDCICPECGEPLVFEGGCNVCKSCGYSKCD